MKNCNEHIIKGAIFDCDGTLLDSLNAWQGLEGELSQAVRVKVTPEERAQFATFTIPEVARYFHEHFGLFSNPDAVIRFIDDYMMEYYSHQAQALPGVISFLETCASADVRMCVVSSSAQRYLQAGLKSAGIADYFSHIFSVEDIDSTKREPAIFEHAQTALGTERTTTWGIDDSLYALETLGLAEFPTIGIGESGSEKAFAEIRKASIFAVNRFDELSIHEGRLFLVAQ